MSDREIEELINDPSRHFDSPRAVLSDSNLSQENKVRILKSWEQSCRLKQVATDEGMGREAVGTQLSEVHEALELAQL